MALNTQAQSSQSQVVLVVDFGAQYAQLIARRVREAKVYSEIVSHRITASELKARKPAAIILSGGPKSVHVDGAPMLDPAIYELGVPIFGICYGTQLIAQQLHQVVGLSIVRHSKFQKLAHQVRISPDQASAHHQHAHFLVRQTK